MPFKLKVIKQLQKSIHQTQFGNAHGQMKQQQNNSIILVPSISKPKKKIIHRYFNFYQQCFLREPLQPHVMNFYNIIGLNEKAVEYPEFEESKFTTIFYIKNVKRVEIKKDVVALELCNSSLSYPPVQYFIERYKSFGNMKFYNLALLLEQAADKLKTINSIKVDQTISDTTEIFEKYVEQLGNKMFICRSTSNKLVISKSLLNLLQYDIQEFALQLIKFKAPLSEILSAAKYFDIISKMIQNLRNLFDLINEKMSMETFLNASTIRIRDYLITKSHKMLFCNLKVGMPNPVLNMIQVQEVVNRNESVQRADAYPDYLMRQNEIEKLRVSREQAQIKMMRRIIALPKNYLPESQIKVCCYQSLAQSLKKKPQRNWE